MAHKPNIQYLVEDRDIEGLVKALRTPDDPEIRARAARGLGQLGNIQTVESLLRAHLQDPDAGAQQAALDALHQLIGSEAELALAAYILPDDAWIEEKGSLEESEDDMEEGNEEDLEEEGLEEDEEPGQASGEMSWDENDIQALFSIIKLDHNLKKRLKAIQALSQIQNTRAIDALASMALWSEEKRLREAAREALAGVYGDSLDEVLESYRQSSPDTVLSGDGDEDDEDDEEDFDLDEDDEDDGEEDEEDLDLDEGEDEDLDEDDEEVEKAEDASFAQGRQNPGGGWPGQPSTVIREEKTGWTTYLLLGLLLVAILAAGVYLLTR